MALRLTVAVLLALLTCGTSRVVRLDTGQGAPEDHATLGGHYTERDPRFVTRGANKDAHNGYQTWHREVDKEVVAWLRRYTKATPEQFEAFLRQVYNRPEMRARFPNGF